MLATFIKASGKCEERPLYEYVAGDGRNACLSKMFGEWYQKTNTKRRYKQINYIGLSSGPYPSQHTVGDPQNLFFSWGFFPYLGPTNQPTNYNVY
jgi:hypothetical protein